MEIQYRKEVSIIIVRKTMKQMLDIRRIHGVVKSLNLHYMPTHYVLYHAIMFTFVHNESGNVNRVAKQ